MSRIEPKAGEWLRQQIDELGALRNASVRDPQFKAWRQNTLTFIQRIWPGDSSKSERFRRVPFTPPSTKHDRNIAREYYERGCGEALEYLNVLLVSLGEPSAVRDEPAERHPDSFEGDFPEVDLGGSALVADGPVGAAPPAALDDAPAGEAALELLDDAAKERSKGPPELPPTAGRPAELGSSGDFLASAAFLDPEGENPGNLPGKPATGPAHPALPEAAGETPMASRISVRGTPPPAEMPAVARPNPLQGILGPPRPEPPPAPMEEATLPPASEEVEATPPARREEVPARSYKNGNGKKKAKTRLKDMLGLSSFETEAPASPAPHSTESYVESTAETPRAGARPPADEMPVRETSKIEVRKPPERQAAAEAAPVTPAPEPAPVASEPYVASPPATHDHFPDHHEIDSEIPAMPDQGAPSFSGGIETSGGWSLPEFMTPPDVLPLTAADLEPAHEEEVASAEPAPAEGAAEAEPEIVAERVAEATEPEEDSGHAARVTAEFMQKSAVLSSLPRPVQRRGAEPTPIAAEAPLGGRGSAASQLLAIAAQVDTLGVPEGHRARARAALMDLARQLDDHDLSWEVLREAIHFVMEFPPLTRRALPLLLPFLDIAA